MVRAFVQKVGGRWVFLSAVVLLYVVVLIVRPAAAGSGLTAFGKLALRVLPVLGIVYGIMFLSNLLLETKQILRFVGRSSGALGWLIAVAAGILSAGPIYLWYPLLSDLKERGMRDALIATFLYNRAVKLPLLPLLVFYLGLEMTTILTAYMVLFSVANGYLVECLGRLNRGGVK